MKPRITAVGNIKGGGTKSTVVQLWATCLPYVTEYLLDGDVKRPEPLLLDYDGQGTSSIFNGVYDARLPTMYHVLKGEVTLEDVIIRKGSYGVSPDGQPLPLVDIIPANDSTHAIDDLYKGSYQYVMGVNKLREVLERTELPYTHILIDTPGTQKPIHLPQAMIAATDLIIPIIPDKANFATLHQTVDLAKDIQGSNNPQLRIDGFLLSRSKATTISDGYGEMVRAIAEDEVLGALRTKVYAASIREKNDIVKSQDQYYALVKRHLNSMQAHEVIAAIAEYQGIFDAEKALAYLELVKKQMTGKES